MTEAYHIAALAFCALGAVFWNSRGALNVSIKIGFALMSAWGAVVVAKDMIG